MNVEKLIVASVATRSVFKRFAQLSDDDKQKVIDKVKEKVTDSGGDGEADAGGADEDSKAAIIKQMDSTSGGGDSGGSADGGEEAAPDESDGTSGDLNSLVDGLSQEIETIKSDGQVTPTEVMGLIDNIVQMVNTLVMAKPARQKKSSDRLASLADRLARDVVAGYSYAVKRLTLEVEGWQPVNVDVLKAISQTWFEAQSDEGDQIEARMDSVRYERVDPKGPVTHQQEQDMKRRRKAPVQRLTGQIPEGSEDEAVRAVGGMLKRRFDLKVVRSKVS